jgi:hypothetical protein
MNSRRRISHAPDLIYGQPIAAWGIWEPVASGRGANFLRSLLQRGRRVLARVGSHGCPPWRPVIGEHLSPGRRGRIVDARRVSSASAIEVSYATTAPWLGGSKGQSEPSIFTTGTAESASIADMGEASRPSTVGRVTPATGAPQKPAATAGGGDACVQLTLSSISLFARTRLKEDRVIVCD